MQGFALDAQKAIFFSLGDFLFDKRENGRGEALLVALEIGKSGSLLHSEVRAIRRNPDLSLQLLEGGDHKAKMVELWELGMAIRTRESDRLYLNWRGSRLTWLWRSVLGDLRAGGLIALKAKVGRLDRHKLRDLLQGR